MLLKNMNVIKCKDRKCCQWGVEALTMPKAPKGKHVFNLYRGPKFVFYLRYPWKLLMQVFINNTAGHPLLTHTSQLHEKGCPCCQALISRPP